MAACHSLTVLNRLRVESLKRVIFSRRSEVRYDTKAVYRGFSCSGIRANRRESIDDTSRWEHPIFSSDRVKDRKSVFLAHASTLLALSQLNNLISHLTSSSDLKKATHCMYAYRIVLDPAKPSTKIVGQHDGGESGSGERLSRLLEANDCNNVVVIVSRWYGGVKLGSDRWKLISAVAKEALLRGKFVKEKNTDSSNTTISGKPGAKKKKK